jgi:arylsulfatase A-like enzyme
MPTRRRLFSTLLLASTARAQNCPASNIVYILLDDTGFAGLHCFGSEFAAPGGRIEAYNQALPNH